MAGAETVQLYIHDPVSTLDKPVKELKTFQKVFLKAGESKEVTLTVSRQDLASYDVKLGMWAAEPGDYELLIGNSSANITSSVKVNVQCENPYAVGPKTDIIKVMSNRKALEIVEKESGIKVREVAGSYVVFQPLTPFETIWEACIKPALKVDEMKSGMMLRRIYSKWKNI
ncbi:MAG: fibronectin type III-like domain-contianing protein [Lachnospiraceae bacterium]|jgi:beta-glucosidase|nr:fibronectin type III-like domain-contianing protein [Lachnospiraceae bacterium]